MTGADRNRRIRRPRALTRGVRVFLRHPSKQDQEEFLTKARSSRRFHYPWVTPATTPKMFSDYLRFAQRDDVCALLVCRLDNGQIVGTINLSQIFLRGFQNAVVGFWAVAEYARQGYMFEGLRLAIRHGFTDLKLHRLEANVQPENLRSRELVQRIGFRLEGFSPRYLKIAGRWRDHERWAIRREEWRGSGRSAGAGSKSPWQSREPFCRSRESATSVSGRVASPRRPPPTTGQFGEPPLPRDS